MTSLMTALESVIRIIISCTEVESTSSRSPQVGLISFSSRVVGSAFSGLWLLSFFVLYGSLILAQDLPALLTV